MMKRTLALVTTVALLAGCDLYQGPAIPSATASDQMTTPVTPAASHDKDNEGPVKYPERPPCRICLASPSLVATPPSLDP
ncbi:MAG: hypothetical protein R3A51_12330 [Nannocystaceae bacterium]|nr:hypothetical protein [Myxococcales bacterium]